MDLKELIAAGLSFKQLHALGFSIKQIKGEDSAPTPGEGEEEAAEATETAATAAGGNDNDKTPPPPADEDGKAATAEDVKKALAKVAEDIKAANDLPARKRVAHTQKGAIIKSKLGTEVSGDVLELTVKIWRAYAKRDIAKASSFRKDFATLTGQKVLSEGTDAAGGFFVPDEFEREVFRIVESFGVARRIFRVLPMATDTKNISSITAKPSAEMVGEASATSGTTQPTIAQVTLTAKKAMANIISSSELIDDSQTDIAVWDLMAELLGEAFALLEDEQCFQGSGAGNNLTGLLISSNAQINIVTMASTKTAFSDLTADNLLDLQDAVSETVNNAGSYLMSRSILNIVRKLKDSQNNYIWQAPAAGTPGTIWDKSYTLTAQFPVAGDTAVSTKFVAYGDWKKAGVLGDRKGLQFKQLTEGTVNSVNLADTDQEALRGIKRFAFSVALGDAVAILRTAAA